MQREKRFISQLGDGAEKTILTYNLNANMLGQDGKIIDTLRTAATVVGWSTWHGAVGSN